MNTIAPRQLTQLVVNHGRLGANWVPIGPQSYPNWHTIVPQLVYDLAVTMGKMVFSIVNNWLTKHPFQKKTNTNPFPLYICYTFVVRFDWKGCLVDELRTIENQKFPQKGSKIGFSNRIISSCNDFTGSTF